VITNSVSFHWRDTNKQIEEEEGYMTGRERVKAALNFGKPDRIPRDLWALPYISLFRQDELDEVLEKYPGDISRPEMSPGSNAEELKRFRKPGLYEDEWGSVWRVGEPGVLGEVRKPVVEDWSDMPSFNPPWETIEDRDLEAINESCAEQDEFMLSAVSARPFERLQFCRGTENVYLDLAMQSDRLMKLLNKIHDFYLEDVQNWASSDVDGVFMMDDWGTNQSLLISPEKWREIFKPLYQEYCDIIHESGKYAFFHTDGFIEPIFGDLIEVGMDAINSQLFCMNIEELAKKYRGKVTFWGEIDRQHVLPFGGPKAVCEAVNRVHKALGGEEGGVIAQCEWGKDNPRGNIEAVFKAWAQCAGERESLA
jgi:hypothetical protein